MREELRIAYSMLCVGVMIFILLFFANAHSVYALPQYNAEEVTSSIGGNIYQNITQNNYYINQSANLTNVCWINKSQNITGYQGFNHTSFYNIEATAPNSWAIRALVKGTGGYGNGGAVELYKTDYSTNENRLATLGCDASSCNYGMLFLYGNSSTGGGRISEISFADKQIPGVWGSNDKRGATLSVDCTAIGTCGYTFTTKNGASFVNSAKYNPNGNVTIYKDLNVAGNISAKFYKGNGSELSEVCLSNGINCIASGGGNVSGDGTSSRLTYWNSASTINQVTKTYVEGELIGFGDSPTERGEEMGGIFLYNRSFMIDNTRLEGSGLYNGFMSRAGGDIWITLAHPDDYSYSVINIWGTPFKINGDWPTIGNASFFTPLYESTGRVCTASNGLCQESTTYEYNQTCVGKTLYNTTFCKGIVGGTVQSCFITSPAGQVDIEVGGWVNGTTSHVFQTLYVNNNVVAMNAHARAAAANPTNLFLQNVSYPSTNTVYNATITTSGGALNWVTIKMEAYKPC